MENKNHFESNDTWFYVTILVIAVGSFTFVGFRTYFSSSVSAAATTTFAISGCAYMIVRRISNNRKQKSLIIKDEDDVKIEADTPVLKKQKRKSIKPYLMAIAISALIAVLIGSVFQKTIFMRGETQITQEKYEWLKHVNKSIEYEDEYVNVRKTGEFNYMSSILAFVMSSVTISLILVNIKRDEA